MSQEVGEGVGVGAGVGAGGGTVPQAKSAPDTRTHEMREKTENET
jgi:hypothetical protein